MTPAFGKRRSVAAAGVIALAALGALGIVLDDPTEPGAVLYAIPVVVVGVTLGGPAGAAAGILGAVLYSVQELYHGYPHEAVELGYRLVTLVFLGVVAGALATRLQRTQRDAARALAETHEELARSEARLAEAQRIAHIGSWEWDVENDVITWSDELFRIWGIDPGRFEPTYARYVELVHPDDREAADAAVQAAFATHEPFAFRHRIVRPDGVVRTIESAGAVFAEEGGATRMAGVAHDVTERVAAEQAYADAAAEVSLQRGMRERAVQLNDAVVQGLALAGYLLDAGDREAALQAVQTTLARSKELVADLIGDVEVAAGSLRRERPVDPVG